METFGWQCSNQPANHPSFGDPRSDLPDLSRDERLTFVEGKLIREIV